MAVVALGGSLGWVLRDKDARRAATQVVVNAALQDSKRLQRQGKWLEAREAARRALGLLAHGETSESLAQRVRRQLADLGMAETLENICLGMRVRGSPTDQEQADRDYAQAFREYGIDIEALPPEVAIDRLQTQAIRPELATA